MEPMFYEGQAVVCQNSKPEVGNWGNKSPLIEGKKYIVTDPNYTNDKDTVFICLAGIEKKAFDQRGFVPLDFDKYAEEEIFEALKGQKIVN